MQREMPVMGVLQVRPKKEAPHQLVAQLRNYREAVVLCIEFGHFTQAQVASRLGIAEGTFSLILRRGGSEKRRRYLDPDLFEAIEDMCGNTAISQYYAAQSKGLLNRQNTSGRKAQLKAELAAIEEMEGQSQTRIA